MTFRPTLKELEALRRELIIGEPFVDDKARIRARIAELDKAIDAERAELEDLVYVSADLMTHWSFEIKVPRRVASAPDFDALQALEDAYANGADWGDLMDHDLAPDSIWVDGAPVPVADPGDLDERSENGTIVRGSLDDVVAAPVTLGDDELEVGHDDETTGGVTR